MFLIRQLRQTTNFILTDYFKENIMKKIKKFILTCSFMVLASVFETQAINEFDDVERNLLRTSHFVVESNEQIQQEDMLTHLSYSGEKTKFNVGNLIKTSYQDWTILTEGALSVRMNAYVLQVDQNVHTRIIEHSWHEGANLLAKVYLCINTNRQTRDQNITMQYRFMNPAEVNMGNLTSLLRKTFGVYARYEGTPVSQLHLIAPQEHMFAIIQALQPEIAQGLNVAAAAA